MKKEIKLKKIQNEKVSDAKLEWGDDLPCMGDCAVGYYWSGYQSGGERYGCVYKMKWTASGWIFW